jgi:hypothetical protein
MSWKHEEPLEEETVDSLAPTLANLLVNGSSEAGEAPPRRIFGFTLLVERHISATRNTRRWLSNSKSSPPHISDEIRGYSERPTLRVERLTWLIRVVSDIRYMYCNTLQSLGTSLILYSIPYISRAVKPVIRVNYKADWYLVFSNLGTVRYLI